MQGDSQAALSNYLNEIEIEKRDLPISVPNTNRWRSKAVLKAMDGVKRAEMFENLRKAHAQVSVAKKMHILNATPNVHQSQLA